jgi:hypothetical protein
MAAKKAAVRKLELGKMIPVGGGRASLFLTSTAVDGRARGWLCRPDGTRLENILIRTIADGEARAEALIAKNKI